MKRTTTDKLVALLRAQRKEARNRSGEVRHTPPWHASSARLDHLNDQIMHVGGLTTVDSDRDPIDEVAPPPAPPIRRLPGGAPA